MITIYNIKKNIDKILRGESTYFIELRDYNKMLYSLKGVKYNIYKAFDECNKIIIYKNKIPNVLLYEIISPIKLRHQDILGSLYSLNISSEMFGDVIVKNNRYYIYILDIVDNYVKNNLTNIKNISITLEKRNIDYLKDYKQEFEENELITSSLRIDTIVSRIIGTNRSNVLDMIKDKKIIVNYEIINRGSYILKENDIFSIIKYGKYKFIGIKKHTKKNNFVIKYLKYI